MGFLDKAKKLAEQAQTKLDEVQTQINQQGSSRPGGQQPGGYVEYDKHGRPIPPQQPAGRSSTTPRAPDPAAAVRDASARRPARGPAARPPASRRPRGRPEPPAATSHGDPLGGAASPPPWPGQSQSPSWPPPGESAPPAGPRPARRRPARPHWAPPPAAPAAPASSGAVFVGPLQLGAAGDPRRAADGAAERPARAHRGRCAAAAGARRAVRPAAAARRGRRPSAGDAGSARGGGGPQQAVVRTAEAQLGGPARGLTGARAILYCHASLRRPAHGHDHALPC